MKWFKENKFVGGLLVVTLLGAGVLGYLLFAAQGKYDENKGVFDQQSAELSRLEHLPAYPDKQNLEVLEAQRVEHVGLIEDLQKTLAATEIPIEPLAPNTFQDQLRVAVTQFTGKATGNMELPKGFYYGFDPYQTAPPTPDAAPLLGRDLKVVQLVLQTLLDQHVSSLTSLTRELLPEEGKARVDPAKTAPPKKAGDRAAAPAVPLVKSHNVDLTFIADQKAVQGVLNALVTNKQQFLIPRYIYLRNLVDHGPSKEAGAAGAPAETPPAAEAAPGTTPPAEATPAAPAAASGATTPGTPTKSPIIVGDEKIEVLLRLEIVDFAKPAPAATPAVKGKPTSGK